MAGRRLLITGGAGFLGYYFTLAATHFNRSAAEGERIDITVYDNLARGAPAWLDELQAAGEVQLETHDMRLPLPADFGPFDYIIHGASIASPTYYRAHPVETMDVNINGLRNLLDYALAQQGRLDPGPRHAVPVEQRDLRRPRPGLDPDPRDLSRPRLLHRPARLLRRGQALWRDALHGVRPPARRAGADRTPVQQLRPGAEDHGRPRAARLRPRRADGPRHRHAVRRHGDAHLLLHRRLGHRLLQGAGPRPRRRALQYRHRDARDLDARAGRPCGRGLGPPVRLQGEGGDEGSRDADYLVDNPNRRCPIITKARAQLGYDPKIEFEDGLDRALLWYRDNQDAAPEPWASTTSSRSGAAA